MAKKRAKKKHSKKKLMPVRDVNQIAAQITKRIAES
jgi:hypothetical protein